MRLSLKKFMRFTAGVVTSVFIMSSFGFAVTDKNTTSAQQTQQKKEQRELYKAIKEVEKSIIRNNDGTLEIKNKPNVKDEYINGFKLHLEEINALIKEGKLETDNNLRIYSDEKYIQKGNLKNDKQNYTDYDVFFKDVLKEQKSISFDVAGKTISLGLNNNASYADAYQPPVGMFCYWWGWQLGLTEYATQVLINGLNCGAGTGAVVAACSAAGIITSAAAVPVGLVSAVLWFGSSYVGLVDSIGSFHGVYFRSYFYVTTPYCWYRS